MSLFQAGAFLCGTITCVKYCMVKRPVLTCSLENHKMKSADIADTGTVYFLYTTCCCVNCCHFSTAESRQFPRLKVWLIHGTRTLSTVLRLCPFAKISTLITRPVLIIPE